MDVQILLASGWCFRNLWCPWSAVSKMRSVNSIHFYQHILSQILIVPDLATTCKHRKSSNHSFSFYSFHDSVQCYRKTRERKASPYAQPTQNYTNAIIHEEYISIRIILSWLCMDRGTSASSSCIFISDGMSYMIIVWPSFSMRSSVCSIILPERLQLLMRSMRRRLYAQFLLWDHNFVLL